MVLAPGAAVAKQPPPSVAAIKAKIIAKPAWHTSEFWQSIAITFVGLGLIVFGIVKPNDTALAWGAGMAGVSSLGYAATRAYAKK